MTIMATIAGQGPSVKELLSRVGRARAIERLGEVLRHPSAHPDEAILVGLSILIALTLIVVIALIALTPAEKKARSDRTPQPTPIRDELRSTRRNALTRGLSRLGGSAIVLVLLVVACGTLYVASSSDRYCLESCHQDARGADVSFAAGHARCVQCHEEPLVSGAIDNVFARARMGVGTVLNAPVDEGVGVPSRRCLRCHLSQVEAGVIVTEVGIAMSHSEPLAAGFPCGDCHSGVGHVPATPRMSDCIDCHDGKTASADCDVCHRRDPSASAFEQMAEGGVQTARGRYPIVFAARRDCGLCHDERTSCDPCHGLRLPHSTGFTARTHASAVARTGVAPCRKCHPKAECDGCHARRDE